MEAARRAVELGRAARAQAKVKMRQPLAKAVIVATEAERADDRGLRRRRQRRAQRQGARVRDRGGELASYAVKPNFRTLGPRFGKDDAAGRRGDRALDAEHVRDAIAGEPRDRDHDRRPRPHARRRGRHAGHGAARRLPGRDRRPAGRSRSRSSSTTTLIARGPCPRGRPRRPERAQGERPRDHRPDRARARRRRGARRRGPGSRGLRRRRGAGRKRRLRRRRRSRGGDRRPPPRSRFDARVALSW